MDARKVNHLQVHLYADAPVVMFRCECGDPECRRTVPLGQEVFRERESRDEPVLYPGHEVVADEPLRAEREWLEVRNRFAGRNV
jgi:hypothetical protein